MLCCVSYRGGNTRPPTAVHSYELKHLSEVPTSRQGSRRLRPPWLPVKVLDPILLHVHEGYEFAPVAVPVMALDEAIAEKIAALRRRRLARDRYDLAWFSRIAFNEAFVRRVAHLKIFVDVVVDGLGGRPFQPPCGHLG